MNKKIKKLYPTEKGEKVYPFLMREGNYSNMVALSGFSEEEIERFYDFLSRVRKNIVVDWENVKSGYKREY